MKTTKEVYEKIRQSAYIGAKGYTIPKSALTTEEINFLKEDLFVKPMTFSVVGTPPESAFPVYRENSNKMYIPRFYGIERYGLPDATELEDGEDIFVEFAKPLRDYQDKIIDVYMNYVAEYPVGGTGGILEVPCGRGKTVMALKIIALLKKKTLIIVHKEFLMNQWIERIAEFLPGATVGKIQGTIFDVDRKDIVIGMIQTLYDKEFPAGTFSKFGLTIVDEVHRIGSEQFSRTLLKAITPYMLGISATVERKDKLTKVLYMFIGEKIYSEVRKDEDAVCVRAIEYISSDDDFNEVVYDFRGNTQFSTMISKISEFGPRSDFIVRVLQDLFDAPDRQIMVLCHNRSLLNYLYSAIQHRMPTTTVGFYVGGMKQKDLQATESKQIVLATYAMAAEALDIKTLSVLVMASPKTDIIQSVGRILRVRHDNPIVVDIVDRHEVFQNQWKKRRAYYKKSNYRILMTDNLKYTGMKELEKWKVVYEPKTGAKEEERICLISSR